MINTIIGTLDHFITIYRRVDVLKYSNNGNESNEYVTIYKGMCNWKVLKPVELYTDSTTVKEPVKYLSTDRIIIPFNPKINDQDTFVKDQFGQMYKVSLVEPVDNNRNYQQLTLTKWLSEND